MQRYRVNYTLLVILLVGMLIFSGGGYALWQYQVNNKAGDLIVQADEKEKAGKTREVPPLLNNYLKIHPDDREVALRFANLMTDIGDPQNKLDLEDWDWKDYHNARSILETTLRKFPDEDELRKRMIDLTVIAGVTFNSEALFHINQLLARQPDNAELMRLKSVCLFQVKDAAAEEFACDLIGLDKASETFDLAKAKASAEPLVYRLLARHFHDERQPELAAAVMNQLVEANPKLVAAYLQRANYRSQNDDEEGAKADLDKAVELDSKDAEALVMNAESQMRELQKLLQDRVKEDNKSTLTEEEVAAPRAMLEAGIAAHPDDWRFYRILASLEMMKRDQEAAKKQLERGLTAVDKRVRIALLEVLAQLQIGAQDLAGARKTAAEIVDAKYPEHYSSNIEAQCLLVEEKWVDAIKLFDRIKPHFENNPPLLAQIYCQIGMCRERLGQTDLASKAYQLAFDTEPTNVAAKDGITRMELARGTAEASKESVEINELIAKFFQMSKEEQEREWPRVEKLIDEQAGKLGYKGAAKTLLKADVFMRRGDHKGAKDLIVKAYAEEPENIQVRRAAYKLVAMDPEQGPVKALERLQVVIDKYGDNPALRLDKADLLIAMNDAAGEKKDEAKLKQDLFALGTGIDDWNLSQRTVFWKELGNKFFQLRMRDEAEQCLKKVADLAPGDLASREMLFRSARMENDDEGMKAAQEEILKVVGSKEHNIWMMCEAHRLLSLVSRGLADEKAIQQADDLITKAIEQRPDWNEPYLLRAEIEVNRGNTAAALRNFDQAMKLGRPTPNALFLYAQLLVQRERWVDARVAMEQLDAAFRQRVFGQLYVETLLNTGSPEEALKTADAVIESDPDNPAKQLWYGQFLLKTVGGGKEFKVKAGADGQLAVESAVMTAEEREALATKLTKAGKALAKTVELSPHAADAWLSWISFLATTQQLDRAAEAIRQAQLVLSEDELPLVLARSYEMTGRWFDAENRYRAAVDNNPDNVQAMRLLAAYYLGNGYPANLKESMVARAIPLVNRIMQTAADGKADPTNPNVLWARRVAAERYAATGKYQDSLKAEKLLSSNAVGGILESEDQFRMALMLAQRPEPVAWEKAEALLVDAKRNQPFDLTQDLILGKLSYMNGRASEDSARWNETRRHMVELIARYPKAEAPRIEYIRMLLERGGANDLKAAKQQVDRLVEVASGSPTTMELVVLLAIKTDKKQEARQALQRLMPPLDQLKPEMFPLLGRVAELLTQLEDYENAEKLYRYIAGKEPRYIPALALFLGTHREVGSCFEILDQLQGKLPPPVLIQAALAAVRERRDDVGTEFDGRIQTWLDRALREEPESVTLQLQQSDLHDLRGEYAQAAQIYRDLLKRSALEDRERAMALNNLAFLLALGAAPETKQGEAYELVQEAVEILGPNSDILDTRAVVYLALGRYSDAVKDLNYSVMAGPTPSKWYHKTRAHLEAKNMEEAARAWKEAIALGLGPEDLNRAEKEQYEQIKEKIENPQLSSASL